MATLYWFTNDLRLVDNPALVLAAQDDAMTCIYCIDDTWAGTDAYGNKRMGHHRRQFLQAALTDLEQALMAKNQHLYRLQGDAKASLKPLLVEGRFDRVVRARQHAADEIQLWQMLQREYPDVEFEEVDVATLFDSQDLPFSESFPNTFSQFRRKVESLAFRSLQSEPDTLPNTLSIDLRGSEYSDISSHGAATLGGGATVGRRYLASYFETTAASSYKETRNQFMGNHFSTGFSPWLACGSLSALQIVQALEQYEAAQGANESTGWIVFELLWREFFKWHSREYQNRLFHHSGIHGEPASLRFDESSFNDWCSGTTQWPLVNACMRELGANGWLSNRGRQLVASCLVNELDLDWRCGAGYFEQQLIDYDPCSNWGNWQYIAGVGVDPRGGRHFNIEKQGQIWDPDFSYRQVWNQR